jgi:LPS export ABC transporter protein LptC
MLAVLVFCGGSLVACNEHTVVRPASPVHEIIPEEADSITSLMSEPVDSGGKLAARVKGKLTAPYMLRFDRSDSPYAEFPRSLHVDFYNDSMQIESKLDAKYGKYLQSQDKVFLRDSVVVKNILKGDTLHCKKLWWDQHTERFTTDDSVWIYTKDKVLTGTGMEADQNFRWYTILHMTGIVLHSGAGVPK